MTDSGEGTMTRLTRITAFIMLPLLCSCINFMSVKDPESREITLDDVNKITSGMSEKELVSTLGSPLSFGIDGEGREYLHYEAGKSSRIDKSVILPFVGVISSTSEFTGFIVDFHIADGIVQGKNQYFIRATTDKRQ